MGQPTGLLRPETRSEAIRNQTGALDGDIFNWSPCPWGLGPELRGAKAPHWTPEASADSFGHVGDSGCIVWTDPVRDTTWAIQCTRAIDGDWFFAAMPEIGAAILSAPR